MSLSEEIGKQLAAYVFSVGNEPNYPTTRIAFKCQVDIAKEMEMGGLCESALANTLAEGLRRVMHRELYGDAVDTPG